MDLVEKQKRELLFVLKVLSDYLGVDDANRTHNSVRIDENNFSIHPFDSVLTKYVTYNDLIECEYKNHNFIQNCGIPELIYNTHRTYYNETDLNFFIHFHDPAVIAVANTRYGLRALSQDSLHVIHDIYHKKYTGLFDDNLTHDFTNMYNNEGKTIVLIQGHGALVMAKTVQEALLKSYMLVRACRIQSVHNDPHPQYLPDIKFDKELNNKVANSLYNAFASHYKLGEL